MKRFWYLGLLVMVIMFVGTGCSEKYVERDSFYFSLWDASGANELLLKTDGTFTLGSISSGDSGTYEIEDDVLHLTSESTGTYDYTIFKTKYILKTSYDGEIPSGDSFRATVRDEGDNAGVVMEFYEDGTMSRQVYVTELYNNRFEGTYTRSDYIVTCECGDYGTFTYIVKDGVMYDAYELDKDYQPTPTNTPTPETTPEATSEITPGATGEVSATPVPTEE